MIGKAILSLAITDTKVDEIICLVRRPTQQQHAKVKEIVIADFLHYSEHHETFKNIAVLYYCVASTPALSIEKLFEKSPSTTRWLWQRPFGLLPQKWPWFCSVVKAQIAPRKAVCRCLGQRKS